MKAMSVAKLKAEFSKVLADVRRGERIGVVYGRSKQPVAMIVPYGAEAAGSGRSAFSTGRSRSISPMATR